MITKKSLNFDPRRPIGALGILIAILGLVLLARVAFWAYKTHAASILVYQYNPSSLGYAYYPNGSGYAFVPVSSGAPSSIQLTIQAYLTSYPVFYIKDGSGTVYATSDGQTPVSNAEQNGAVMTFYFLSGATSLQAGTTYYLTVSGWNNGYNAIAYDSADASKLWLNVYALVPAISLTTGGGYNIIGSNFNVQYSITIPAAGSYTTRLLYDNQTSGYSLFTDGVGQSYPAGTYNKTFYITNLYNGQYGNFRAVLMDYNGNILASVTSSLSLTVSSTLPINNIPTSYLFNYKDWYASSVPSFFATYDTTTPTIFFSGVASGIDSVLNFVYGIVGGLMSNLSTQNAITYGAAVNGSLQKVFSAAKSFDSLAGGFPFSATLFFFIMAQFVIVAIKLVRVVLFR